MTMPGDDKPATKGDLKELREATKGDLGQLGAELRAEMATKGDLGQLGAELRAETATKGDFVRLDSKIDMVWAQVVKTWARMEQMEERLLLEFRQFRDELTHTYEDSVTKGKMFADKALTHGDMISSHELRLADHERRLSAMEPPPQV